MICTALLIFLSFNRQMYWTDTGTINTIEKASMDGTSRRVLHSTNINDPFGLTLDTATQTLYWADVTRNVLEKSNTDGTDRVLLTNRMILDPYYLTYYDGSLYWSDWTYNRLLTTRVNSPDDVMFFGGGIGADAYGIQVVTPEKQLQS